MESIDEPWFVGARVATTVTILKKQKEEEERLNNVVRFVQLRKSLGDIMRHDGTAAGAVTAADAFRDEILSLSINTVNERYRSRLVKQADLFEAGVRLGLILKKAPSEIDDEEIEEDLAEEE